MPDKPNPCPFCGEPPELRKHHQDELYCLVHYCEFGQVYTGYIPKPGLVARWNTKAESTTTERQKWLMVLQTDDALEIANSLFAENWDCWNGFMWNGDEEEFPPEAISDMASRRDSEETDTGTALP